MLSEYEFNILYYLYKSENHTMRCTQRDLAQLLQVSLGKTNKLIKALTDAQLITACASEYSLTEEGLEILAPYKVENAVIMAAGMSTHFAPISYEKPKGLLEVRGEVLIEREIRQLKEAGIEHITVVIGYLKEKFFYLEDKYGVRLVINPDYYRYNNTSTLMCVLRELGNTYVCSSDNYFVENVFESHVYRAYYSTVYKAGEMEGWCVKAAPDGRIKSAVLGGINSWHLLGHAYFDKEFSLQFAQILKEEYKKDETRNQQWESVYARNIKSLDMYIREYASDKVLKFDSLDQLRDFDPDYINNADPGIIDHICSVLKCEKKDIHGIVSIKKGLTNTSFKFEVGDDVYVYRHPGIGTDQYINRQSEAFTMAKVSELGLDGTFIAMDPVEGWKISHYVENSRELDYHIHSDVKKALEKMRILHDARIQSEYDFDIWNKTLEFIDKLKAVGKTDFEGFAEQFEDMKTIHEMVAHDEYAVRCLCHNDCYAPNFLLDDAGDVYLIDWEYSGNEDPASDLGNFICYSDYGETEVLELITEYLGYKPAGDELKHYLGYVAIVSYYWYVWAIYQEFRGNTMGMGTYIWYKSSKLYARQTLKL